MLYRPDGIDQINARATIETSDDPPAYIGVQITGYVQPDGTMVDSYVRFLTGHEKYKWINDTVFLARGGQYLLWMIPMRFTIITINKPSVY